MPDTQFFLRNGNDFKTHFDVAREIFDKTNAAVVATLYTTDDDHPLCMKVSSPVDLQGVSHVISNVVPNVKYVVEFSYKCDSSQAIGVLVYDQINAATISYVASQAASVWRNFYKAVTTPAGCSTLKLQLERNNANTSHAFYIDDVYVQGNALLADPDTYSKSHPDRDFLHETEDGITVDRTGKHVSFNLHFPMLSNTDFRRLYDASRADEPCYFDDGNVPISTQSAILRTSTTYNYVGVTTAHGYSGYKTATTATIPVLATDFQSTEFTNQEYTDISLDNAAYATHAITGTGKYGYHRFSLKATQYATAGHVRKFTVTWKGLAEDLSTDNVDGVDMYAWDGYNWVKLDTSRTQDKQTLSFSTSKKEIAQQFVDTVSQVIRLIVKTRGSKQTSGNLTLKTYYVHCVVNDALSREVSFRNKAVLTAAGSVVSVRNLTTDKTLVKGQLTTGYNVSDDREGIDVTSDQSDGDLIEAKYNQRYKVRISALNEETVFPSRVSSPYRAVSMQMDTLTPIEE